MTEPTVESIFGINAGVVWQALNQHGPSNIGNLVKTTSLSREEVYAGLAWLGRENKINVVKQGRALVFSLREEEARLKPVEDTTIADSAPQTQSKPRRSKQPKKTQKKTPKPRKSKAPIKQSERMEEFPLH